jgi:hypothetical protein
MSFTNSLSTFPRSTDEEDSLPCVSRVSVMKSDTTTCERSPSWLNVTGLVLAGSADFKSDLASSDLLDGRLGAKVIKIVDVSYGSENGFNQGTQNPFNDINIQCIAFNQSYCLSQL